MRDPDVIKQMAVKDFEHFQNHQAFLDEKSDILFGNSLFMMQDQKWHDMRATLSPAFTGSKMRQMFELVTDTAYEMTQYFRQQTADGQQFHTEVKEMFSKYTNDVIASTAFGIKVNSFKDRDNAFFLTGKKIQNFSGLKFAIKTILLLVCPKIYLLLGLQFLDRSAAVFFKAMVLDTIAERTKHGIFRPDMINILMQLRNGVESEVSNVAGGQTKELNDGFATTDELSVGNVESTTTRQWTDDELVAQCFLFFLGGFETSATALMFTAYELAINPDIQERLYAEVAETNRKLGGKKLPYDELQKMKYLDQVISEMLRLWPPAVVMDRVCSKDYEYNDDGSTQFRIDKGTLVWIPIYGLHHDAKYYPEPERFDPERFSDAHKGDIVAGSYLPFGVGPRNCIGRLMLP